MENLSYREQMIVRYNSRRSFGSPHLSSPKVPHHRVSDIDFSDVFGGPPRCSMAETRHSLGDTFSTRNDEALQSHSNPWATSAALGAKPVFGEGSPIRRHLGQNFFYDIFKAEEPSSSTSRNSDLNLLSSASFPNSRVLSPVHNSLPNRPEPLLVGSTLSRQLSLSKVARKLDFPASDTPRGSSSSRSKDGKMSASRWPSSLNMSASQVVPGHEESEDDIRHSYCQSPLSNQVSLSSDKSSSGVETVGQDAGTQLVKGQFHFSLYKLAGKGIPLTTAFRGGKRKNVNIAARENGITDGSAAPTVKVDQLSSLNEKVSVNGSSEEQSDHQGSGSSKSANVNKEGKPSKLVSETLYNLLSRDDDKLDDTAKSFSSKVGVLHELNDGNSVESGKSKTSQVAKEKGGNLESIRDISVDDDTTKLEKRHGKKNVFSNKNATKLPSQDATVVTGATVEKKVKGKVQEFIKIFSQEASPKPAPSRDSQTRRFKKKSFEGSKLEDGNTNKSLADNDVRVNQTSEQPDESLFAKKGTTFSSSVQSSNKPLPDNVARVNHTLEQLNEPLFAKKEPIPETFDMAVDYIEVLDGKIKKWSNGKEGNIRSHLSTLQYVSKSFRDMVATVY